jgi:hypothetical protein
MATGTSFNTRRALGRRYSIDPALQLEYDRLNQEYSLVPGREARALQASQFQQGREDQRDAQRQAATAGYIGTGANLVGMGMVSNAYRGRDLLSNPFGSSSPVSTTTGTVTPPAAGATGLGAGGTELLGQGAYADAAASATVAEGGTAVGSSITPSVSSATPAGIGMTGALATGAGYLGYQASHALVGENFATERERDQINYGVAGASAGAVIGSAVLPGPGTVIGAGIGGVVGLTYGTLRNTWICTATNKHVGTSKQERASLKKLRRYTKEHYPGWLEFYNQEGPKLIKAIEGKEPDLVIFYGNIKKTLVQPCVKLIDDGDLEAAFNLYKDITAGLFEEYTPNIEVKEVF